jgi:hypothetical protein
VAEWDHAQLVNPALDEIHRSSRASTAQQPRSWKTARATREVPFRVSSHVISRRPVPRVSSCREQIVNKEAAACTPARWATAATRSSTAALRRPPWELGQVLDRVGNRDPRGFARPRLIEEVVVQKLEHCQRDGRPPRQPREPPPPRAVEPPVGNQQH